MSLLHRPASEGHGAQYTVRESAKLLYTDSLQTAHVVRAAACERGYPYILEKMQKEGPEKVPLWACTKSGPKLYPIEWTR